MKNNLTVEEQSERKAKIRRLQADMFILQSDKLRLERKKNDLVSDIRKMKTNLDHLKADLEEKIGIERALAKEISQVDETLAHTKKKMDTLK